MQNQNRHQSSCLRLLHIAMAMSMLLVVSWGLLSTDPLAAVDDTSFRVIQRVDDFVLHVLVYTTMAVTLTPLAANRRPHVQQVLVGFLFAHAAVTELLQVIIPRRVCDPLDLAANVLGIALGVHLAGRWPGIVAGLQKRIGIETSHLQ